MAELKLEVGKTYLNRLGERVTVRRSGNDTYSFTDGEKYYMEDGVWCKGEENPCDLVHELNSFTFKRDELLQGALCGHRGPDQQRIAQVGTSWVLTMLQKNNDYGSSVWEPPLLAPHIETGAAILARMSDKINRLRTLLGNEGQAAEVDESIEDTLSDLGAYCLLYLARPKGDEV